MHNRLAVFVSLENGQKLDELMMELHTPWQEMEKKLSASITEFKQEVTSVLGRTAQGFSHKLPSYHFGKKETKCSSHLMQERKNRLHWPGNSWRCTKDGPY